jgi:hypothetical protein
LAEGRYFFRHYAKQIGTAVYQRCGSNPSDRRTNWDCSVPTVWFESLWSKNKSVLQCTNGVVRIPLIEEQIGTAVYQRCGSNPSDWRTNWYCSVPTVWFESLWLKNKLVLQCTNGVVRILPIEEQNTLAMHLVLVCKLFRCIYYYLSVQYRHVHWRPNTL